MEKIGFKQSLRKEQGHKIMDNLCEGISVRNENIQLRIGRRAESGDNG